MRYIGEKYDDVHFISNAEWHSALRQILHGQYSRPFVLLGCPPRLFEDTGAKIWALVIGPEQGEDTGEITDDVAHQIIEKYGMVRTYSSGEGRVYELRGEPFRERYGGYYTTKHLDRIWPTLFSAQIVPAGLSGPETYATLSGDEVAIHAPGNVCAFIREIVEGEPTQAQRQLRIFLEGRRLKLHEI